MLEPQLLVLLPIPVRRHFEQTLHALLALCQALFGLFACSDIEPEADHAAVCGLAIRDQQPDIVAEQILVIAFVGIEMFFNPTLDVIHFVELVPVLKSALIECPRHVSVEFSGQKQIGDLAVDFTKAPVAKHDAIIWAVQHHARFQVVKRLNHADVLVLGLLQAQLQTRNQRKFSMTGHNAFSNSHLSADLCSPIRATTLLAIFCDLFLEGDPPHFAFCRMFPARRGCGKTRIAFTKVIWVFATGAWRRNQALFVGDQGK